jgi:hypothetical protein
MIQEALIILAFAAALFYLGRLIYLSFFSKTAHCPGCSGCSSIDFSKIEKEMKDKYGIS